MITQGEFEFSLSTKGYGGRAQATWEGAAVGTVDLVTLGQYFDADDRAAFAYRWGDNAFYAQGGYFVAQQTIITAVTIATAGAFSGVGAAGNVGAIGLKSWTIAGGLTGAWAGAANAGAEGGGAGDMLGGAALGGAIGAGTTLLAAGAGRLLGALFRPLGRAGTAIRRATTTVGSGEHGVPSAPMRVVRTIGKGERMADLLNEIKVGQFTTKNEHAIVRLASGERAVVSGGPGGIEFPLDKVRRVFVHTHPYDIPSIGPSPFDFQMLRDTGHQTSYVLERGVLTKFSIK